MANLKKINSSELRSVKSILEEVIVETLLYLDPETEMASLKADPILNKIIKKPSIEPYVEKSVAKKQNVEFSQKEKHLKRIDVLLNETLPKIEKEEYRVFHIVAETLNLNVHLLRSSYKDREYVDARKMVAYILTRYFNYSSKRAGKTLNRDHSTVLYAVWSHRDYMETDAIYARKFFEVITNVRKELGEVIDFDTDERAAYVETLRQFNGRKRRPNLITVNTPNTVKPKLI
jgi:hypothetical protein